MKQYRDLINLVQSKSYYRDDRTGVGCYSVFGAQVRYDLQDGFPLLTTKKLHWKSIIHELLWMLRGETNIAALHDAGVTIWDEWADERGDLGPVYGEQWRSWKTGPAGDAKPIDQIEQLIEGLRTQPDSRRHVVSAWNPAAVAAVLPACHCLFQFAILGGRLHCQLYQRSADLFLGVPYNVASYAALTHIISHMINVPVGEFIHTFGDLHAYSNHLDQLKLQLGREPRRLPRLKILCDPKEDPGYYVPGDFEITDYDPHPHIPGKVAV